jgi:hypothetical protein
LFISALLSIIAGGLSIAAEPTVDVGFETLTSDSFCRNRVFGIQEYSVLQSPVFQPFCSDFSKKSFSV